MLIRQYAYHDTQTEKRRCVQRQHNCRLAGTSFVHLTVLSVDFLAVVVKSASGR